MGTMDFHESFLRKGMEKERARMTSPQETGHNSLHVLDWEVLNPEGVKLTKEFKIPPHPVSLTGKTVALIWDGKPNGDIILNKVGELLLTQAQIGKLIKLWEVFPNLIRTYNLPRSAELARTVSTLKPDLVINSTCD
jgi:hypothetical protein